MDAQELNQITYDHTEELTDNPEVTCRERSTGRLFRIVDSETEDREPGEPFVLEIEAYPEDEQP